ncbi:MAG: hypothetical protein IPK03_03690 [Bacteroidetes bacterium]|nr:hypothetical protein [Bacteroidota bacterium]
MIKINDDSKYKNMVDILDEMHICGIKLYAIIDISEPEKQLISTALANAK